MHAHFSKLYGHAMLYDSLSRRKCLIILAQSTWRWCSSLISLIRRHKKQSCFSPGGFSKFDEGGRFFFFFASEQSRSTVLSCRCWLHIQLLSFMLNVIYTCVCFRAYICTNTCLNIFHVWKSFKKESGISIFERFSSIPNALSAFLLKKKKVMRYPKVRREGMRNNFVFLCGLTYNHRALQDFSL